MTLSKKISPRDVIQSGSRVYLKRPRARDSAELIAVNIASQRFFRGLVSPPIKPEHFDFYLKRCREPNYVGMLVCRLKDQAIMGMINLSQIYYFGFQSCYMGYHIGVQFANQGYMSEAIQLALKHAFVDLKLHRVEANIQPDNLASIALVKRTGFTLEGYSRRYLKINGRWRDHERWAILLEDWRAMMRKHNRKYKKNNREVN
jgi:ribosomal-protein-alanine N-acetyltransferase